MNTQQAGGFRQQKEEPNNRTVFIGKVRPRNYRNDPNAQLTYYPFKEPGKGAVHFTICVEKPLGVDESGQQKVRNDDFLVNVTTNKSISEQTLKSLVPGMTVRVVGELANESFNGRDGQPHTHTVLNAFVLEIRGYAQQPMQYQQPGQAYAPQAPQYQQPYAPYPGIPQQGMMPQQGGYPMTHYPQPVYQQVVEYPQGAPQQYAQQPQMSQRQAPQQPAFRPNYPAPAQAQAPAQQAQALQKAGLQKPVTAQAPQKPSGPVPPYYQQPPAPVDDLPEDIGDMPEGI